MVERLKAAIEKARQERAAQGEAAADAAHAAARHEDEAPPRSPSRALVNPPQPAPAEAWARLPEGTVDEARLDRERIVTYRKTHPAHVPFDLLRTKLLKVCRDRGWRRIGISSPTKGCGKSLTAANLAFSVARHQDARALLVDLDLRAPRIAHVLGLRGPRSVSAWLHGRATLEETFLRFGQSLAVAANTTPERDAAELMQGERTARTLAAAIATLGPDLVIYDLPPMLLVDDAVGFMPNIDAMLLVAGAGQTRAQELKDCERLIGEGTAFLGIVLNRVTEGGTETDAYEYYAA